MNYRFSSLLVLGVSLAATSCMQKLDDGLASGGAQQVERELPACTPQQGFACHFEPDLETPKIGLVQDPESGDATKDADKDDGCEKVNFDVIALLDAKCKGCHEGAGNSPGFPLTFILDVQQLTSTRSSQMFQGMPYIVPGDPDHSLIYKRAVLMRDMPKQDPLKPPSFLTVSEASNLREWIRSCVPGAHPNHGSGGSGGMSAGGQGGEEPMGGTGGTGGMASGGTSASAGKGGAANNGGTANGGTANGGKGGAAGAPPGAGGAGSPGAGTGGTSSGGGGTTGVAGGGAGGSGGGFFRGPPCAQLCQNATTFTVPPTYQSGNLGAAPGCFQTSSTVQGFVCGNMGGRTFSINGQNLNCNSLPLPSAIPLRNGGYCVRVTPANAGGDLNAYFSAF